MKKKHDKLDFIHDALRSREEEHQFRSLKKVEPASDPSIVKMEGRELINFCSNDYMGLARHPKVIRKAQEYTEKYGTGATASRLVSGNFNIHEELEEQLAETLDVEAALVFNTGFQANITLIASLADRHSLILADRKVHNSLLQGAMLSRADLKRYHHNDYKHLEELLQKARPQDYNRIWIVSETVFSMDGDRSDLGELIRLAETYGALLYSDDAHAVGVLGDKGLGLNYGKSGIDLSLGTFGKAFGVFGAFAGCTKAMKDYLVNFCPGFIYTTALPPAVIGAVSASLHLIPDMEEERAKLYSHIHYFRKELNQLGFNTGTSDSQIIPVIIGDEKKTIRLSEWLTEQGIWASAIRPPTVGKKSSRIRVTITANHSPEQIDQLTEAFRAWKKK